MKCPHCKKTIYRHTLADIDKAERHAECYGPGFTTSECPICHEKFTFYTEVKTVICKPIKATKEEALSY